MSKLNALLKKPAESMSLLEAWPIFFNFADNPEHRDLINNLINTREEIKMASELLMTISQDEKERAHFRSRRMYETDLFSNIKTAEDRGIRKGREEILQLLNDGVSVDEIKKRFNK